MSTNARPIALVMTARRLDNRRSPIGRAIRPPNIERTGGVLLGATTGPSVARCAYGYIALIKLQRACGHLASRLVRHGAKPIERFLFNAEHAMFDLIAVGHRATTKHRRGTRDIGNRRGNHTRRQRLRRRDRHTTGTRALDNIARQFLVVCGD